MANSVYFEATLIDFGKPPKPQGYSLPQDFEATSIYFDDTSKDVETTSIDWRLG